MKFAGQIIGLVVLLAGGRAGAGDLALAAHPYAVVVERNIFGLVPIPVVDPAATAPPANPPPKITPNGIMSIFGKVQVLFKVPSKPKPGQPAKDESYVLCEGERQDDIEVMKIDEAGGLVTFKNHGEVQQLTLANAPNISTPAAPAAGAGGGGIPVPGAGGPGMSSGNFGRPRNVSPGSPGSPGVNPSAPGMTSAPGVGGRAPGFNPAENISPEAQVILIEAQRQQWKQGGNHNPMILPPTAITQQIEQEETGGGGGPPMPGQ